MYTGSLQYVVFYIDKYGIMRKVSRERFLNHSYKNAKAIILPTHVIIPVGSQFYCLSLDDCMPAIRRALKKAKPSIVDAFVKTMFLSCIRGLKM